MAGILILPGDESRFVINHNVGCKDISKSGAGLINRPAFLNSFRLNGVTSIPSSRICLSETPVIFRPAISRDPSRSRASINPRTP